MQAPLFIVRKPSPFVRPQLYAIVIGKQGPAQERVMGMTPDGPVVETRPSAEVGIGGEGREVALIIPGCGEVDREELRDIARAVASRPRRIKRDRDDLMAVWRELQEKYRHYLGRTTGLRTHHGQFARTRNA